MLLTYYCEAIAGRKMKCKENFRKVIVLLVIHSACITFASRSKEYNEFRAKFPSRRYASWKSESESDPIFEASEVKHHRARRQTTCFPPITCNANSLYRTIDGTCNNLNNVYWGASGTPFARFLTPTYGVGGSPRGTGGNLPRARLVTSGMVSTVNPPSLVPDAITLMVMQWGQFCDHDLNFTPEDNVTNCCTSTHTSCLPINVAGDSFYTQHGINCLPFVRSRVSPCISSRREQINELTSYLDASQVYGSTQAELTALRVANSFLLKFGPGKEVTSCTATDPAFSCRSFLPVRNNANTGNEEFFAGDRRVEEQPGLTALHTIFVRMHNDLATQIKNKNTACSNEIIFQETRKIIIAVMQQITYSEFLPIILGPDVMSFFRLALGSFQGYDATIDASAPNVFATASFRFGHSLIKNIFTLITRSVELARNFNNHVITTTAGASPSHFMRGISADLSEPMDHIIADAVHNKLFASAAVNFAHGEDLYARNIQRGRDHGIPSYEQWLNFNEQIGCWAGLNIKDNLNTYIPSEVVNKMSSLYGGILDNVDLFPMAIAEHNVPSGLLGPTFACLNGHHFHKLKFGDRFWFEKSGVFTANQLTSIRATKLSDILCRYTDATQLQRFVMMPGGTTSNPNESCMSRPGVIKDVATYWTNLCTTG